MSKENNYMPKVEYVEKTIFSLEGVNVDFIKDGKNVRDDASLPKNYKIGKATKNSANVTFLINKLQMQFPGYDFTEKGIGLEEICYLEMFEIHIWNKKYLVFNKNQQEISHLYRW